METSKSLIELSRITGLPMVAFELALELYKPKCSATTSDEAKSEYYSTITRGGTAQEIARNVAALDTWISLCLTIEDAMDAWNETPKKSASERAALLKMIELYNNT